MYTFLLEILMIYVQFNLGKDISFISINHISFSYDHRTKKAKQCVTKITYHCNQTCNVTVDTLDSVHQFFIAYYDTYGLLFVEENA